jgi:hypothetical protein
MSTLKEDVQHLSDRVDALNLRLQNVEQRLAVVLWVLGIATGILSAVAADLARTFLHL